jgi:hypothetical protein
MGTASIHEGVRRMRFSSLLDRTEAKELTQAAALSLSGSTCGRFNVGRTATRRRAMTGWSTGAWGGARRGGRRRKSWSGCWRLFRDKYADFTVKHFHERLRKRPRRPLPGMLLHQDGSRHAWIEGLPAMDRL